MSRSPAMRPEGYDGFLEDLKQRIRTAQVRAVLAVNRELILLYWQIGREILERQDRAGWGAKIIESLASDLHREFPDMKGFSRTNLYMRAFAEAWPDEPFVQQVVGQIPWGHNLRILDLAKTQPEREWYIRQTVQNGWSRNVLVLQDRVRPLLPSREGADELQRDPAGAAIGPGAAGSQGPIQLRLPHARGGRPRARVGIRASGTLAEVSP
jgi:predicted nuclease of restriction endonuclease-like (RecB) superfamily